MSKKFHIPVIVEVECETLAEAQRAAYKMLQSTSFNDFPGGDEGEITPATFVIADDERTDRVNHRVFFLHPKDTDAEYDPEEYESILEMKNKKENKG